MSRTSGVAYVREDELLYNVKAHGLVGDGATDDEPALTALLTLIAGRAYGGIVAFPPGSYRFNHPPTIPAGFWHFLGLGNPPGGTVQYSRSPQTQFVGNANGGFDTFQVFNNTNGVTIENIAFVGINGRGLYVKASAGVKLVNCSGLGVGGAAQTPILIEDTFWLDWLGGSAVAPSTALPSVEIRSDQGGVVGSYLLNFERLTLGKGGIWFRQNGVPATVIRNITLRNITTESFDGTAAGGKAVFDVGGAVACNIGAVEFDGIEVADSVTLAPALMTVATGCTIGTISIDRVANIRGVILNGTATCQSALINGNRFGTSVTAFVQDAAGNIGAANQVFITDPGAAWSANNTYGGAGAAVHQTFVEGDDPSFPRHRVKASGQHDWGPGGGVATDTTMFRGGVGFLAVPMKIKAGVPSDADYNTAPPNGTLAINSSTNKIYCRIGGVWTQVTA